MTSLLGVLSYRGVLRWARSLWWLIGLGTLIAATWIGGLRLNLTRSMPIGLYRITRGLPVRGATVLVCLPSDIAAFARKRGYVPHGGVCAHGTVPIGKVVLGVSGDTVTVLPAGLLLNGAPVPNSRTLASDHLGRSLPRLPYGTRVLGCGTLWLHSPYSAWSFDSRYFGPVHREFVVAVVRPMLTARSFEVWQP
jgi:conjugative transfer signal peptidase TraF